MKNRHDKSKRFLAFVTILSILISLLPVTAFAGPVLTVNTREVYDTDVKSTSIYVGGEVTIDDTSKLYSKGVAYSEERNDAKPKKMKTKRQSNEYAFTLTKLKPSTTYYIRAYAHYYNEYNEIITQYGDEITVKTNPTEVLMDSVAEPTFERISSSEASFKSSYSMLGHTVLSSGIVYSSTTNSPTLRGTGVSSVGGPATEKSGTISGKVTDIDNNKNYYVRAFVEVQNPEAINPKSIIFYSNAVMYPKGALYANVATYADVALYLASSVSVPEVSTRSASISGNYIQARGEVSGSALSLATVSQKGFVYSSSRSWPTLEDSSWDISYSDGTDFYSEIYISNNDVDGYYVRAYIKTSNGTFYGSPLHTSTDSYNSNVYLSSITDIVSDGAEINFSVSNSGGSSIRERGVVYSTVNSSPTLYGYEDQYKTVSGTTGSTYVRLTGLRSGTRYYVRAYAKDSSGSISYSSRDSFTTTGYNDGSGGYYDSRIQTVDVRSISAQSAVGFGYVGSGSYTVTERGFVYSSSNTSPTISDAKVSDASGGTGDYSINLTSLYKNTKYYVRAFIRTSQGISYGNTLNFTTYNSSGQVPAYTPAGSSYITENAFMDGVGSYRFAPDEPVKRVEVAQIIYRLSNGQHYGGGVAFPDVPASLPGKSAIDYVSANRLMRGYPDGSFRPDATITRAELAVVLTSAYSLSGLASSSFSDVNANSWAYSYISLASKAGMITGYTDGTYRPGNTATRAEACKIFSMAANRSLTAISNVPFSDVPTSHWAYGYIMNASVSRP